MKPSSRDRVDMNVPMTPQILIGGLVGAVLGFAWYKLVGCSGGACPLTSRPFITILYGAALGAFAASSFH